MPVKILTAWTLHTSHIRLRRQNMMAALGGTGGGGAGLRRFGCSSRGGAPRGTFGHSGGGFMGDKKGLGLGVDLSPALTRSIICSVNFR